MSRCLNPQTPEVRPLGAPFTPPQKIFGGFWKTRVLHPHVFGDLDLLDRFLGGGFKYFLFSPLLGEDSNFD